MFNTLLCVCELSVCKCITQALLFPAILFVRRTILGRSFPSKDVKNAWTITVSLHNTLVEWLV